MAPIPPSVIGTAAPILADWYTHTQLNALFDSHGFPGDAPDGNKIEKCRLWLRHGNKELPDALNNFGNLIAEMMDAEFVPPYRPAWDTSEVKEVPDPRKRLLAALAKEGLSYARGGYIHGASLTGPSKSLRERLKTNGMQTVETEFKRAYDSIESDPPQAVTAACSILEALCKNYLEIEAEGGPNKQVLGNLFPQVMTHLGLSPKDVVDDDLKQILSGMYSIAIGIAALRTHAGSAHGRSDKKNYKIEPPARAPGRSLGSHPDNVHPRNLGSPKKMNRDLWEKYVSQKRFPAFPCPRCKQGTLGYDAKNIKIMEPPYSRAAHGHEAWESGVD